jgi:hypothetical protein
MNRLLGKRATFTPDYSASNKGTSYDYVRPVSGTVVHVHEEHQWFTVEYNIDGVKIWESFKFSDIGKRVQFRGY